MRELIEFPILEEDILRAKKRNIDPPYKGAFYSDGRGRTWGLLGEECCYRILKLYYPTIIQSSDTFNCDLRYKGLKIDIKTKTRKEEPRIDFDASVPAYQIQNQMCDIYVFCQLLAERHLDRRGSIQAFAGIANVGWIVGVIWKIEFVRNATFYTKGSVDKNNGLVYKNDTYVLPYSKLHNIEEVIK